MNCKYILLKRRKTSFVFRTAYRHSTVCTIVRVWNNMNWIDLSDIGREGTASYQFRGPLHAHVRDSTQDMCVASSSSIMAST